MRHAARHRTVRSSVQIAGTRERDRAREEEEFEQGEEREGGDNPTVH